VIPPSLHEMGKCGKKKNLLRENAQIVRSRSARGDRERT
jgi:hypothetical protein